MGEAAQERLGTGVTYFWMNPWQQQPPERLARLRDRDGFLYIVREYPREEPDGLIEQMWYPTGIRTDRFIRDYYRGSSFPEEGIIADDLTFGDFRVATGFRPMDIALKEGGKTQAEFVEKRIVPPPKVRSTTKLRWRGAHGVWEKSTKSTRWHWVEA